MLFSRLPHLHSRRRKSKPLELEPLEARQTPSHGGLGAAGRAMADSTPGGQYTFTTLNSFDGANGATPGSPLVIDARGNMFGTTTRGGLNNQGTIYTIPAGTRSIGALASFSRSQGSSPAGSLLVDGHGNVFGTATQGGASNRGTLFTLKNGKSVIKPLASFHGTTNGSKPASGLTSGPQGNLYGTAQSGGAFHAGTVFVVSPGSPTVRTLAEFNRFNGASPSSALVSDSQGNLFGTARLGGIQSRGTVFEIIANTSQIVKLASFNGKDGAHPMGPLVVDAAGNLYGTTTGGGDAGLGTIFEIRAGSGTITKLASFGDNSGHKATGALVRDARGDLIGTAQLGGAAGNGTVFELGSGSSIVAPLVTFTGPNGARPTASLVVDTQGTILGTTSKGGQHGKGTVFELSPDW